MFALAAAGCSGARGGAEGGARPEVVLHDAAEYRYYAVEGSDASSIRESLDRGAQQLEGRRGWGATHWDIRWRAQWASTGPLCRVTEVDVQLRIEVVLPRWEPSRGAGEGLARDWQALVAALSRHEAGHVDIASAAARAVRAAISRVTARTCDGMDARTRAEGERVVRDYTEQQRLYDERTELGAAQGVAWPPRPSR